MNLMNVYASAVRRTAGAESRIPNLLFLEVIFPCVLRKAHQLRRRHVKQAQRRLAPMRWLFRVWLDEVKFAKSFHSWRASLLRRRVVQTPMVCRTLWFIRERVTCATRGRRAFSRAGDLVI